MYQKISGHENQIGPQSLLIFPNTVREAAPFRQKLTVSQQFLFWKHLVHLFQFTWNQYLQYITFSVRRFSATPALTSHTF